MITLQGNSMKINSYPMSICLWTAHSAALRFRSHRQAALCRDYEDYFLHDLRVAFSIKKTLNLPAKYIQGQKKDSRLRPSRHGACDASATAGFLGLLVCQEGKRSLELSNLGL